MKHHPATWLVHDVQHTCGSESALFRARVNSGLFFPPVNEFNELFPLPVDVGDCIAPSRMPLTGPLGGVAAVGPPSEV